MNPYELNIKRVYHISLMATGSFILFMSFVNQVIIGILPDNPWYFRFTNWFALTIAIGLISTNWKGWRVLETKQE